jgi:hypothetical protein
MLKDLSIGSTVESDPSLSETGPLRTAEFLGFVILGTAVSLVLALDSEQGFGKFSSEHLGSGFD